MKKDVKFITEEQALRYMPNDYFQKDAFWNKVRSTIDNNKFAGNFYCSLWQGGGDGYLYELDEHDDYVVRRQNLKEGEIIYRYFTRRSAFTGQVPFIKINIDKGLLYFLKDDEEGLDLIEFETKGIPVRYLNIIPPNKEEYAKGGEVLYDWEKEQDPRAEQLKGRTILLQVFKNEDGELMPLNTKITKVIFPSSSYPNPTLKIQHSTLEFPYGNLFWGNEFKGDEIDKFLNGQEIHNDEYRGWLTMKLMKEMKKMAEGGYVDKGGNDKKWNQYVLENRSWFDDETNEDSLKDEIILATRRHGNTSQEEVGQFDIDEAKNIIKKVIAKFPKTQYKIERVDEYVYLYLRADKTLEELEYEKQQNENQKIKNNYKQEIVKQLNISIEQADKIIESLSYPKEYYEKNKNKNPKNYNNSFRVYYQNGSPSNIEFNSAKEVFDYINTDEFIKSVYYRSNPRNEILISLYGWDSLRIKYDADGRPFLPNEEIDWSNRGRILVVYPFIKTNIKNLDDLEEKLRKTISDFIICYKIYVLNEKDESKDFLDELENMNFEDDSLYMKNGGKLAWQNVQVGDKALVISENKLGLVIKPYGRRFHLKFPDGTEKTYSAEELEFFKDEEYAKGGGLLMIPNNIADEIKKSISMGYDIIREGLISPKRKGIMLSNEDYKVRGTFPLELKNAIQKMIDDSKMKKGGTLEGGVKKNMLFDKNGERRIDPEAIAYIENTVEMLPQTKFMYTTDDGKYKPERKKLHDEIIATFHEGKPCIDKRPAVAILTGGAPASGKTTFIKKYVDLDPEKVYHVDADEVRAMLPEYRGWNATQTHLETADIVNRLIDDIGVPCDHDLIYDGTMNKATKYEKIVDKLHKLGYKVFVVYISIPEQVSKERVIARYKKAGRYVPMKVIEEVYDMGLTAFEKVAHEMADGYIRIDGMNGEIIEEGGMAMPSNIEYDKGGKIDDNKLKNATALVRSAERFAEMESGKPVKKGRGMASASISDGKRKYKSVTVFFEDGTITTFEEEEFPKFFMKDGGELGSQDYYDGFQMQVVQKKGNPDKEVQKENIKMTYRKGGKL
jgi:predicted ABC-type ATPase